MTSLLSVLGPQPSFASSAGAPAALTGKSFLILGQINYYVPFVGLFFSALLRLPRTEEGIQT
jgi:hypothetical protein